MSSTIPHELVVKQYQDLEKVSQEAQALEQEVLEFVLNPQNNYQTIKMFFFRKAPELDQGSILSVRLGNIEKEIDDNYASMIAPALQGQPPKPGDAGVFTQRVLKNIQEQKQPNQKITFTNLISQVKQQTLPTTPLTEAVKRAMQKISLSQKKLPDIGAHTNDLAQVMQTIDDTEEQEFINQYLEVLSKDPNIKIITENILEGEYVKASELIETRFQNQSTSNVNQEIAKLVDNVYKSRQGSLKKAQTEEQRIISHAWKKETTDDLVAYIDGAISRISRKDNFSTERIEKIKKTVIGSKNEFSEALKYASKLNAKGYINWLTKRKKSKPALTNSAIKLLEAIQCEVDSANHKFNGIRELAKNKTSEEVIKLYTESKEEKENSILNAIIDKWVAKINELNQEIAAYNADKKKPQGNKILVFGIHKGSKALGVNKFKAQIKKLCLQIKILGDTCIDTKQELETINNYLRDPKGKTEQEYFKTTLNVIKDSHEIMLKVDTENKKIDDIEAQLKEAEDKLKQEASEENKAAYAKILFYADQLKEDLKPQTSKNKVFDDVSQSQTQHNGKIYQFQKDINTKTQNKKEPIPDQETLQIYLSLKAELVLFQEAKESASSATGLVNNFLAARKTEKILQGSAAAVTNALKDPLSKVFPILAELGKGKAMDNDDKNILLQAHQALQDIYAKQLIEKEDQEVQNSLNHLFILISQTLGIPFYDVTLDEDTTALLSRTTRKIKVSKVKEKSNISGYSIEPYLETANYILEYIEQDFTQEIEENIANNEFEKQAERITGIIDLFSQIGEAIRLDEFKSDTSYSVYINCLQKIIKKTAEFVNGQIKDNKNNLMPTFIEIRNFFMVASQPTSKIPRSLKPTITIEILLELMSELPSKFKGESPVSLPAPKKIQMTGNQTAQDGTVLRTQDVLNAALLDAQAQSPKLKVETPKDSDDGTSSGPPTEEIPKVTVEKPPKKESEDDKKYKKAQRAQFANMTQQNKKIQGGGIVSQFAGTEKDYWKQNREGPYYDVNTLQSDCLHYIGPLLEGQQLEGEFTEDDVDQLGFLIRESEKMLAEAKQHNYYGLVKKDLKNKFNTYIKEMKRVRKALAGNLGINLKKRDDELAKAKEQQKAKRTRGNLQYTIKHKKESNPSAKGTGGLGVLNMVIKKRAEDTKSQNKQD